ncbi:MAG TPA: DUF1236 domain-containing protein [Rhizobiaceae bacterium]|nr:DUF1236 domain-containing protein [Rhizobiaceae bacterium]
MKNTLIATVAATAIAAGLSVAQAQTVVVSPEQETVIREYVVKQEAQPVEIGPDVEISVGATLPDEVELHAVEAEGLDANYEYVVVEGRTVLVEPGTRRIVHIIE